MHGARFRQEFTLEDAIGSHACSLEVNMRATNGIPFGCSLLLPVDTVNCVQTPKVYAPALVELVDFVGGAAELRFYDGKLIRVPLQQIFAVGEETFENARDYIISVVD
jgi:hypothetical protein